jgi:hypothetical protein
MRKFDLSRLPPAVRGVPIPGAPNAAHNAHANAGIVDAVAHGHNEQIDVNLSLANITRFTISMFGVTAAFAALTTEQGVRQRLQCSLAAASCAVCTWFYTRFYAIRSTKGLAYSLTGTAAVDSLRYSCWTVTNGALAWLAVLLHGPFEPAASTHMGLTYAQWLYVAPTLSSLSVLCAGSAQFCAESAKYHASGSRGFRGWGLLGLVFLASAVSASTVTNLTLQQGGDPSARTPTEILVGQWLGRLWFVYPLVNLAKAVVTFFTDHNADELGVLPFGNRVVRFGHWCEIVREIVLTVFRILSSSHAYSPLSPGEMEHERERMGYAFVPPVYTQIFDAVLAIADLVSIGIPAFACTALAMPVDS